MKKRRIDLPDGTGKVEVEVEDEVLPRDRAANADTLRQQVDAALGANRVFLAIANPTTPQTAAQVILLTRECSALIRLLLERLENTD